MTYGAVQIRRQRGVVLLALFAILFIAGAGALISVLDFNSVKQSRDNEAMIALREAKEALIAYASLYAINYNPLVGINIGPGYLPCPDTNGNGVEAVTCAGNSLGRLPRSIVLPGPAGSIFSLSDHKADIDEQIWYSVSGNFSRSPMGVLNSSTLSGFTLNGQAGIAAVVIAPGVPNISQSRPSNISNRYLEDSNTAPPNFVSTTTVNPDLFNDRVLAITIDDIMRPVTRQAAALLKTQLDIFHVANLRYPANHAEFILNIAPTTPWYVANLWPSQLLTVPNYVRVSDDQVILRFTGCANMSYTVLYDPPNTNDDLRRTGLRC